MSTTPLGGASWATGFRSLVGCSLSGAFVLVALVCAPRAAAADWPHLRGPSHNGHAEPFDLDLSNLENGPQFVWRATIGEGYSGFIVFEGRACTQAQSHAGQFVVCLDVLTGDVLWKSRYSRPHDLGSHWPGPYATPAYRQGRIFFAGSDGIVGAMDAANGRVLWTVDTETEYAGKGTEFGYAASPLVLDDTVFLPIGGENASVIALNTEDGTLRWSRGSDRASYVPSYPITVEGRLQIVSLLKRFIVAHDPLTGVELWRHDLGDRYNPHAAWPVFEAPYLFTAFALRHGSQALRPFYHEGNPDVELVWTSDSFSNEVSSSVIVDGFVYGFDIHDPQSDSNGTTKGEFKCVELSTGREQWATAVTGNASVVTDGKHLVLFNENGVLIIARATPAEYQEVSRTTVFRDRVAWTAPTPYRSQVILRSRSEVACVHLGDPGPLTRNAAGLGVKTGTGESLVDIWVRQHHGRGFWAPSAGELGLWFLASLVLALLVPLALTAPLEGLRGTAFVLFFTASIVIGIGGFPILTELMGRLVFTWPAALFTAFLGVYLLAVMAHRSTGWRQASLARLAMLAFILLCVGYYLTCQRFDMVSGWGFLVGFLPAWPMVHVLSLQALAGESRQKLLVSGIVAFSLYFWGSVLIFGWKAGLL